MKCLRDHMWLRKISLFILDILLITLSVYLSMELRFEMYIPTRHARTMMDALPVIWVAYMGCYALGGVYKIMWRYAGVRDTARLCVLSAIACGLTLAANQFLNLGLFRGVLILIGLIGTIAVGGTRMFWRLCSKDRIPGGLGDAQPVMIVGAGEAGAYAVNICNKNPKKMGRPVLLVDDAPSKQGLRIQNVPVRGKTEDIPKLAARYGIREIIVAIPSLGNGGRMQHILELCNEAHCHTRLLSEPADPASEEGVPFIRELNISDFLSREEIELDTDAIAGYLTGKTVMVTGGGGSIGSEICRQIMRFKPKLLIIFEIYENCAYELEYELRQKYGKNCPVTTLIGSIRDRQRLDEVFEAYHPEVVFHAAAHKHVPLMERSPAEAIKNNVFGTQNLLESASAHGVERLVQLSTDKAVNPTNVMGCSKRICEIYVQSLDKALKDGKVKGETQFVTTRFGNVLGSNGSVIPLFKRQIKQGGPITVTHKDIIRYFMLIPEACKLVLEAGTMGKGGEIYVFDMGKPVKIVDLAQRMIQLSGAKNIEIKFTGLRDGEKLYEEVLNEEETTKPTYHPKIKIANVREYEYADVLKQIDELVAASYEEDMQVVKHMKELVPEFKSQHSKYEQLDK